MAPIRVRPGLLQEQDCNILTADHVGIKPFFPEAKCSSVVLEQRWSSPLHTASYAGAAFAEKVLGKGAPPEL
jgi:hypothetical protein